MKPVRWGLPAENPLRCRCDRQSRSKDRQGAPAYEKKRVLMQWFSMGRTPPAVRDHAGDRSRVSGPRRGCHHYRQSHLGQKEIVPVLEREPRLLRPANYPPQPRARLRDRTSSRQAACRAQPAGTHLHAPVDDPFRAADALLSECREQADFVVIDFHAEATSEKQAFARYPGWPCVCRGRDTHTCTNRRRTSFCQGEQQPLRTWG